MSYPKYYKNNQRYTCLKSAKEFIQVNTFKTVSTITYGSNEHFVSDAYKYDVEITLNEFEAAFMLSLDGVIEKYNEGDK